MLIVGCYSMLYIMLYHTVTEFLKTNLNVIMHHASIVQIVFAGQ